MWMLPKKFDFHWVEDTVEVLSVLFIAGTAIAFILLWVAIFYFA